MGQHQGKVIKGIIRQSGYTLTKLAEALGMSRNTLYSRLQRPHVEEDFILAVGKVIHYDFSVEFSMAQEGHCPSMGHPLLVREGMSLMKKYIFLLEKYNQLLLVLAKTMGKYPMAVPESLCEVFQQGAVDMDETTVALTPTSLS